MLYQKLHFSTRTLCIAFGVIVVLAIWQITIASGAISNLLLPSPASVGQALVALMKTPSFWMDIGSTTGTWLLGVVIGTLVGGSVGFLLGLNSYVWAATEPWVEFLRALPSVVLIPLVSLFLGVGAGSRFACAALVVILLMISSSATALHATRSSYMRLAVAWRASRVQLLRDFYLPATLSHLTIALRAAIPLALIVTVAADMLIATDSGIGRILMDSLAVFDTKKLYAGIIVVGLLGYGAAHISAAIESKTIHWGGA